MATAIDIAIIIDVLYNTCKIEKDEFKQHMKTRPSVRSLTSELHQIVDWQLLLLKLGMEKHEIDKIERNFPQDVDRQKLEALALWLRETPDACWKYVIAALFDMKENTLATELTRKYNWKDPRVSIEIDVDYNNFYTKLPLPFSTHSHTHSHAYIHYHKQMYNIKACTL